MSKTYPEYLAIAQDLNSDNCEWSIFGGKDAETAAKRRVEQWCEYYGARWVGFVRPVGDPTFTVNYK